MGASYTAFRRSCLPIYVASQEVFPPRRSLKLQSLKSGCLPVYPALFIERYRVIPIVGGHSFVEQELLHEGIDGGLFLARVVRTAMPMAALYETDILRSTERFVNFTCGAHTLNAVVAPEPLPTDIAQSKQAARRCQANQLMVIKRQPIDVAIEFGDGRPEPRLLSVGVGKPLHVV